MSNRRRSRHGARICVLMDVTFRTKLNVEKRHIHDVLSSASLHLNPHFKPSADWPFHIARLRSRHLQSYPPSLLWALFRPIAIPASNSLNSMSNVHAAPRALPGIEQRRLWPRAPSVRLYELNDAAERAWCACAFASASPRVPSPRRDLTAGGVLVGGADATIYLLEASEKDILLGEGEELSRISETIRFRTKTLGTRRMWQ